MVGKLVLKLILLFGYYMAHSQIRGVVANKNTKEPIPYTNIWMVDRNIGSTSNQEGQFAFETCFGEDSILMHFSALGYEDFHIGTEHISDTVFLLSSPFRLDEIVVSKDTTYKTQYIAPFDKNQVFMYATTAKEPLIIAKFFPYKEIYQDTPFLEELYVLTQSTVKHAKFNIRLYHAREDSSPGRPIFLQNIFGCADNKKAVTRIDLRKYGIKIPETGVFIGVEWLIIDENAQNNSTLLDELSGEIGTGIAYQPIFGLLPSTADCNAWRYENGRWSKAERHRFRKPSQRYFNKYNHLAMSLLLGN